MALRVLVAALVLLAGQRCAAQCCGDCNGDGEVSISELVTAVNNALNGCSAPTPTPAPAVRCPDTFFDVAATGPVCEWQGRFSERCGDPITVKLIAGGPHEARLRVDAAKLTLVVSLPDRSNGTQNVVRIDYDSGLQVGTLGYLAFIQDFDGSLQIATASPPGLFLVGDCVFDSFSGAFVGLVPR